MKKPVFLFFALIVSYCSYAQKEHPTVNMMIEFYEEFYDLNYPKEQPKKTNTPTTTPTKTPTTTESICIPQPDDFYTLFDTKELTTLGYLKDGYSKFFSFSDPYYCSPLKIPLKKTSNFGYRKHPVTKVRDFHSGIDFDLDIGDTVYSVFCGEVRFVGQGKGYGNVIVVRHYNMSETLYAHLSAILVKANQKVTVGQPIGLGGNTGVSTAAHLHFELRYNGSPINPAPFQKDYLLKDYSISP